MKSSYKSALEKLRLEDKKKDKVKALFYEIREEKENAMKVKRFLRPAAALAACLVLAIVTYAVCPVFQREAEDHSGTAAGNYFSVTAYAKELTNTGKVFSNEYASHFGVMDDADRGGISFSLEFPMECKGKNIDTITYKIKEGRFQITNPPHKSIVVGGNKLKNIDAPGRSMEDEKNDKLTYEKNQYKSFTVRYGNQSNAKTCIDIVDTSNVWGKERWNEYKKLPDPFGEISLQERKKLYNFLTKDMGITCTVKYKDGTKETKSIMISHEIVRPSEVFDESIPKEKDQKRVIPCFSIR